MIRYLASDVDGVLTNMNSLLDTEAFKAIRKAEKNNIRVILASGASLVGMFKTHRFFGTTGPVICENGGVILDTKTRQTRVLADSKKPEEAFRAVKKRFPEARKWLDRENRLTEVCMERRVSIEKIKGIVESFGLTVLDTNIAIHIKHPHITKGFGLEKISEWYNIDLGEVAAVGDSPNDIEMLEVAGEAYAVANATSDVKEKADYVASKEFGSGLLEIVNKILKN